MKNLKNFHCSKKIIIKIINLGGIEMQIVINNENKELTYELNFNEEEVINLIDEIIEKCAFRKKGRYVVYARSKAEAEITIAKNIFWKEIKTYENVFDFRAEDFNDPMGYWRPGDPKPFSFEAEAIVVPDLVNYLMNILNEKDIDYNWFINREELHKKDDMLKKVQNLDLEINKISNFDWDKKIKMLEEFATIFKQFNNIPCFDAELLSSFYDETENCIKLELIQETIKYQKKLSNNK